MEAHNYAGGPGKLEALLHEERALRAVLEGLPDATVATGRDGRIVFVNAHAETLFGYEHGELLGRPVQTLWPEKVRERYTRNMQLYFATEHPLRFTIRADGLRRDGTEFVGEMSWGIVDTEAGPLLLAIGRDMTAHREAMSKLQRQSQQAAAVAALGARALSGADVGDLAVEAVARMRETLAIDYVVVRRAGEVLADWGGDGAELTRFEIAFGDEVFGEICVEGTLGDDEESFLRAIANVLATALGRLRGEERMRHEALHDPLTGLANRALCRERLIHALARAGRDPGAACVLFIDLDDFKAVNDLYGHAAGDSLLIGLARRLVATVRPADTVARLGGDEFVIVCEDIDEHTAIALGHRLTEAIHEPLEIDGIEHRLSASIGIALGDPARRDPDGLLADADAAAYRAKAEGRGRVEVFDTRLRRHARERLRTAAALERALSLGQLRLAFQPIVSLTDRGVVGHEALLRWDSPGGVMNAPADFIPVAEESALIVEIGAWTLMQACHESASAFGREEDGPAIWVNLSPRQLAQPDLPAVVADCLQSSGLPPARLRLELKERVLQGAPKTARANVVALRELGVGFALDDFGTGYSSLRDLPVRAIKIDRSFVAALGSSAGDQAIVAAIVSLSSALGIAAIAEGVESEEQAAQLAAIGCPYAQGYLFGAPGPRITSEP
ncbi:EAL domain-containing protein [Solirubrobacter sp. CPCC 204708]|uniref:EAL domain-containing protein n=1 Tax=Solirubrobacter deserti TaxID=2282478 RepID=A0ABT4RDC1_9ACTN|nr:bifunctional diguanylate cyclase/phosphodiesterase [Solirubrobacter deserti]MBE2317893.1 EAL domain-containing protein [Solirubrobacter deserti]MDA0136330.1 EAL domain-containing protein [Solirubrobacter deserti]